MKSTPHVFLIGIVAALLTSCIGNPDDRPAPRDTPSSLTVTLILNGGGRDTITVVKNGDKLDRPINPAKNGFSFKGWYTDKALTTGFEFVPSSGDPVEKSRASITSDITLYAKYAQKISTSDELQAINEKLDSYFELANDITLPSGTNWKPIGSIRQPFTGEFDGKGYVIKDLNIDRPNEDNVGLFGVLSGNGIIRNAWVEVVSVKGSTHVGALLGYNLQGAISGYAIQAQKGAAVEGKRVVGGLIGGNNTGSSSAVGVAGYSNLDVSADGAAGGLVGFNFGSVHGYAVGNVTGKVDGGIGGLVGETGGSSVVTGYARGLVTRGANNDKKSFGLVIGLVAAGAQITAYHSTVTGESEVKGFAMDEQKTGVDGTAIAVVNTTQQKDFALSFSNTTGSWTFNAGHWPAINFSSDVNAKLDQQPITSPSDTAPRAYTITLNLRGGGGTNVTRFTAIDGQKPVEKPDIKTLPKPPFDATSSSSSVDNVGEFEGWYSDRDLTQRFDFDKDIVKADIILYAKYRYFIANAARFQLLRDTLNGSFKLRNDITLANGINWRPIGDVNKPFTGDFDGAGFAIRNLSIDSEDSDVGFFGVVGKGGSVRNVGLEVVSVRGQNGVGALVGNNNSDIVSGYVISAQGGQGVAGTQDVGGLVGINSGSKVIGHANIDVRADYVVGGLVGYNSNNGEIIGYARGNVEGQAGVGGLVGKVENGAVTGYARGNISRSAQSTLPQFGQVIGDTGSSINVRKLYRSGKMGESGLAVQNHTGIDGVAITVSANTKETDFSEFTFGTAVGQWIFTSGQWPAIRFDVEVNQLQATTP